MNEAGKKEQWQQGLIDIEKKYINLFKNYESTDASKSHADIEEFIAYSGDGSYKFYSVFGVELPISVQNEINLLAREIYPQ